MKIFPYEHSIPATEMKMSLLLMRCLSKAPSLRIRIFLKMHLFYPFWVSVHTETAFSVIKNEAFRKRSSEWIVWTGENEAFENADVTASIYDVPELANGSLGITQGHLDCLLSFVKVRTEEFECSSVFVWTGIFSEALLVWPRIFFIRIKMRFHKYPDTCRWGLNNGHVSHF